MFSERIAPLEVEIFLKKNILKLWLAFTDFASSFVIKIIKYQLSRARNQTVLNYCDENLTKAKAMISDEVIKRK